jgi:H+/Na+-translocating ferredoxin:NAD+ oxidoreductase subunit D
MNLLKVSGSPHVHSGQSVNKIMRNVVFAMLPALAVSFYFFGLGAMKVTLVAIVACLFFEWIIQKYLIKGPVTINDWSAVITGILLAFNVPSNLPIWMIVLGALVAIGMGKMTFGGLGKNPFNPALVGRVFLLISFPVDMTSWPKPIESAGQLTDAITGPTPLGVMKEGLASGETVSTMMGKVPSYVDMLYGMQGGSLGEVSAILLLLGGLFLLFKKIITWHIPVAYFGSVLLFTGILWLVDPTMYVNPLFHLVTGGLMLGVFYMATDMVTSPMSKKGMLIFGIGCGIITIVIRVWGAYPEGVSFAILIMNAFVPLINNAFKPKKFGLVK